MKRLILLILFLGLLVFVSRVTVDERHERWPDHAPRHGHRLHLTGGPTKAPKPEEAATPSEELKIRTVVGRVSATEERARADASRELEAEVARWLDPEVPPSWGPRPPTPIVGVNITPIEKPYGTVYTATIHADFSDSHRARLVQAYHRDVARDRMFKLGGLFVFALVCLAAVTAFIRADEATKGYHTTRLRLLATAAVIAAGYLIYLLLV